MATNADSIFPTASGLMRAEYPDTTPRDSSLRTRDCTADTDSPAVTARGQRGPPVDDEFPHQLAVDLVELHRFMRVFVGFTHGGTVSESEDRAMSRLREELRAAMSHRVETWELRAKFAAALSQMYAAEVPSYTTLVEVSASVNRKYAEGTPGADRLGSLQRVTAERHGAIRVGSARELADLADLFAAFGMYPVGFYDLRDAASPMPVVSTAFRPIDTEQLDRNPFRVFTSMLATGDARFFPVDLRRRVERFVAARELFDPALIAEARRIAADGGAEPGRANRFLADVVAVFRAVARTDRPRLARRADQSVGGGRRHRRRAHHAHQPPDSARARHRRAVPAHDGPRYHHDRRHPGSACVAWPRCVVAADVISCAGRATAIPRCRRHGVRRHAAGTLRRGRIARRRPDPAGARALRRRDGWT